MCRVARAQQSNNSEEIAEIEQIFLNLPSVKNVRVKIKATFFGRDWARTAPLGDRSVRNHIALCTAVSVQ